MNYHNYLTTFIILLSCSFFSCGQDKEFNEADKKIITELGFDLELINQIRNYTDSLFSISKGNPDAMICFKDSLNYVKFSKKNLLGLTFNENNTKTQTIDAKIIFSFTCIFYAV